jgi:RNA polymerase sigma-70 factor (ECF subfamily)
MMLMHMLATAVAPVGAAMPVPGADDTALITRVLAGDERAFATLYRRHVDKVFGLLTRLVGYVPEREDLVQQIFADVYRALPGFRGQAAFSTFLYRIATRAAYDHLSRRSRSRTSADIDGVYDEPIADDLTPDQQAQRRRDIEHALALLAQLKPKKRIAFVLVVIEGMSLREAAAVTGASPDAVKQQVLHARKELEAMEARRRRREQSP